MSAHLAPVLPAFAASLSAAPASFDDATAEHAAILLADHLARVSEGPAVDAAAAAVASDAATAGVDERCALRAELGAASDRDDVHWLRLVHPGSVVWPTVLGLGAANERSGAQVLRAAVLGYEVTVRLAAMLPGTSTYHLTALTATVGAAAAAAAILDPGGTVDPNALGHAISVAGGSMGAIRELSGTRRFHRGQAVRTGIAAARAARRGLDATRTDLEHGGGAWAGASPAKLESTTPDGWGMRTTSPRVFPTSGWNQTVYEAARAAATGLRGPILEVAVRAPDSAIARSVPRDLADADLWNSLEHAVASGVAIASGSSPLSHLRDLVVVEAGPIAHVRVTAADGTREASVELPNGHPERPANLEDLAASWSMTLPAAQSLLAELREWLRSDRPRTFS